MSCGPLRDVDARTSLARALERISDEQLFERVAELIRLNPRRGMKMRSRADVDAQLAHQMQSRMTAPLFCQKETS